MICTNLYMFLLLSFICKRPQSCVLKSQISRIVTGIRTYKPFSYKKQSFESWVCIIFCVCSSIEFWGLILRRYDCLRNFLGDSLSSNNTKDLKQTEKKLEESIRKIRARKVFLHLFKIFNILWIHIFMIIWFIFCSFSFRMNCFL